MLSLQKYGKNGSHFEIQDGGRSGDMKIWQHWFSHSLMS